MPSLREINQYAPFFEFLSNMENQRDRQAPGGAASSYGPHDGFNFPSQPPPPPGFGGFHHAPPPPPFGPGAFYFYNNPQGFVERFKHHESDAEPSDAERDETMTGDEVEIDNDATATEKAGEPSENVPDKGNDNDDQDPPKPHHHHKHHGGHHGASGFGCHGGPGAGAPPFWGWSGPNGGGKGCRRRGLCRANGGPGQGAGGQGACARGMGMGGCGGGRGKCRGGAGACGRGMGGGFGAAEFGGGRCPLRGAAGFGACGGGAGFGAFGGCPRAAAAGGCPRAAFGGCPRAAAAGCSFAEGGAPFAPPPPMHPMAFGCPFAEGGAPYMGPGCPFFPRFMRRGRCPFAPGSPDENNGTDEDFTPDVDVFDTEHAFVIHMSLPGVKKEDVSINWDSEKSELKVTGIIVRPGDEEFLKTIALDERKTGPFSRSVRLGTIANPAVVEVEGISASLENGILIVTVPKTEREYVEVKKVDIQ